MRLHILFSYYGGKWRTAKHYPKPRYKRLIEPFAGSAGYALHYPELAVELYEINDKVFGVWDYLIKSDPEEIMSLPSVVEDVRDLLVCQEAKWLIGFWVNKGTSSPCNLPSQWMRTGTRPNSYWGEAIKTRIASGVSKIKHWKVFHKSYRNSPEVEATWFIDPPYSGRGGSHYKWTIDDYGYLAEWCRERRGQVIVCETEGANWLPFRPFRMIRTNPGKNGYSYSEEVVWCNYDPDQR